jgi:hypothetical protein
MTFFPPAKFDITANATQAIAEFKGVGRALSDLDKQALTAGGAINALEKSARLSGAAFKYLGLAIVGVAGVSLRALEKVEQAQSRLTTAITNSGVEYSAAQPYIKQQTDNLRQLGFTTRDTYSALAQMIKVTRSPRQALENLGLAADLARAGSVSLTEAGDMLAKAALGQTKALGQFGIQMGVTIKKGATYEEILKALEERVKGSAIAFRNTLGGSLAVANANFEELKVKIGEDLLPTAIQLTDWITSTALPKLEQLGAWFTTHKDSIVKFAAAFATLWTVGKITTFVSAVVAAGKVLVGVYKAIMVSAIAARAAELMAMNIFLGPTAAVAGTALLGLAVDKASGTLDKYFTLPSAPSSSGAMSYNQMRMAQIGGGDITGTGMPKVPQTPKATPKPTPTVVQNITVYATNTNDIAKNLARTAKGGMPIGSGR